MKQTQEFSQVASNEIFRTASIPEDYDVILELIKKHQQYQVPRLERLNRYFLGYNDGIENRDKRKGEDKADYRASHAFAENITTFRTSYLAGNPIKTSIAEEDDLNAWLESWNQQQYIDAHNLDVVTDLSKYGRAYELLNYSEEDRIEIAISNPMWSFVVYDESVRQEPLFGVRYPTVMRDGIEQYAIVVYLPEEVWYFDPVDVGSQRLEEPKKLPHRFGGVPLVEYSANRFRVGDYEKVLSLIDLYDYAQSDTANHMTDTNDSLLVVVGDFDPEEVHYDRDSNALFLRSGFTADGQQTTLSAQYIYPQYDVAGTEAYKDRLRRDIYAFTYTPDTTDEQFGGNQSGIAMKYKLIGLEQDRAIKERLIRKGLVRRYEMLFNQAKVVDGSFTYEAQAGDLEVIFTPNLPANVMEEVATLTSAGAKFSQATLLAQASFVDNVQDELKAVDKERDDNMNFMRRQMGGVDRHEHVLGETTATGDEVSSREGPESTGGL